MSFNFYDCWAANYFFLVCFSTVPILIYGFGYETGPPIFANSIDEKPNYPLDKIEHLEPSASQIIISTSKNGPADNLHVHIGVTDLEDDRKLPPIDLNGLWLTFNRGRYTVTFLKPNRWYGIDYSIERGKEKFREQRMVKTLSPKASDHTNNESIFGVNIDRHSGSAQNPEGVYVTMKWMQQNRPKNGEVVVKLRVHCGKESSENEIVLPANKDMQTVQLQMDNKYELEDVDSQKHQVKAKISPLKCHTVCWSPIFRVNSKVASQKFEKEFNEECRNIDTITSTTYLRELKSFKIDERNLGNPELIVVTEYMSNDDDGMVTLSALPLGANSSSLIRKQFSTKNSSNEFHLPLEEDTSYAVQYEYIKIHPFHFSSKVQFLVETSEFNTSAPSQPIVRAEFKPNASQASKDSNKETPDYPTIVLGLHEGLQNRDIIVKTEPFCGLEPKNMVLNGSSTQREINMTDFICLKAFKNRPSYCTKNSTDYDSNCSKNKEEFCYTTSVLIGKDQFPSPVQCVNVTEKFYHIINESRKSIFPIFFNLAYFLVIYLML